MKTKEIKIKGVLTINTNTTPIYYDEEPIREQVAEPIIEPLMPQKDMVLDIYKSQKIILKYITLFTKRVIDIISSIAGIILLIPISIIIFIANIFSKDFGPLFYSHKRIGKNGKYFKMYKFRSMCVDADEKLKDLLEKDEEAKKEWEANQKLENDPRITKIGKFIRKTSLDEFPQFINVLKGEMSLVRT